jgi:hypothetical protein
MAILCWAAKNSLRGTNGILLQCSCRFVVVSLCWKVVPPFTAELPLLSGPRPDAAMGGAGAPPPPRSFR